MDPTRADAPRSHALQQTARDHAVIDDLVGRLGEVLADAEAFLTTEGTPS